MSRRLTPAPASSSKRASITGESTPAASRRLRTSVQSDTRVSSCVVFQRRQLLRLIFGGERIENWI
jgi:hypothetical protein